MVAVSTASLVLDVVHISIRDGTCVGYAHSDRSSDCSRGEDKFNKEPLDGNAEKR